MCEKIVNYRAESLYEFNTCMELRGSRNFKGRIRNTVVVFKFPARKRPDGRRVGIRRFVRARDERESRVSYGEKHEKGALRSKRKGKAVSRFGYENYDSASCLREYRFG